MNAPRSDHREAIKAAAAELATESLFRHADTEADRENLWKLVTVSRSYLFPKPVKRRMGGRRRTTVLNAIDTLEKELPALMSRWEGRRIPGKALPWLATIRTAIEEESPFATIEDAIARDHRLHFAVHMMAQAASPAFGGAVLTARQLFDLAVLAEQEPVTAASPERVRDRLEHIFRVSWEGRYARAKVKARQFLKAEVQRAEGTVARLAGLAVQAQHVEALEFARATLRVLESA